MGVGWSKPFDVSTVGLTGVVTLKHEGETVDFGIVI